MKLIDVFTGESMTDWDSDDEQEATENIYFLLEKHSPDKVKQMIDDEIHELSVKQYHRILKMILLEKDKQLQN